MQVQSIIDDDEITRQLIVDHDIFDGPAALRELVAELWPELVRKIKPPFSEMHS
jgi:hypothetical protein